MRSKVTSDSGNLATLDDFATKISGIAKEGRTLAATIFDAAKEARSSKGQNILAQVRIKEADQMVTVAPQELQSFK